MSEIIKRDLPIVDGQAIAEAQVFRRQKLQKPVKYTIAEPKPAAAAIAELFGAKLDPVIGEYTLRDKLLKIECTRLRWMKPDGNGGLVPR